VSWSWQECEYLITEGHGTCWQDSIHLVHDDNKDKDFELEMTWVCTESGNKHKAVPEELLKEADAKGKAALEEGMEED
jgi:20S proteasome subunit alpha 7